MQPPEKKITTASIVTRVTWVRVAVYSDVQLIVFHVAVERNTQERMNCRQPM